MPIGKCMTRYRGKDYHLGHFSHIFDEEIMRALLPKEAFETRWAGEKYIYFQSTMKSDNLPFHCIRIGNTKNLFTRT